MLGNKLGTKRIAYTPSYVVFDLETTGISAAADQVIEISAVKVENGQVTGEFSTLVNPGMPIPWQASRVNHIYDDMVKDSPDFRTALRSFLDFAGDAVLVGHNIHSFDMKFLYRDARKFWNGIPDNDYIDTLQLARYCLPQLRHHRLTDLAEYYGISSAGAHRALADCRMNQQVFEMLGRELKGKSGIAGLTGTSDKPCMPEKSGKPAPSVCRAGLRSCPKCGGIMVKRNGRYGMFYGCSGYPVCRHTEKL